MKARKRSIPYVKTEPSAFLYDISPLIDTPVEIASLLNGPPIRRADHRLFTHLNPDHVEGIRVIEQIALDFRTRHTYPKKLIYLLLSEQRSKRIKEIRSQYGPVIDFYREGRFIRIKSFRDQTRIGDMFGWAVNKMTIWGAVQKAASEIDIKLDAKELPHGEADGTV